MAKTGVAANAGVLGSTGVIAVDDTGVAASAKLNLTKLLLDANDALVLGTGDYDLTSAQINKALSSLATAGVVNFWANAQGEDLFGIPVTSIDKIYLSAGRDYSLGLEQLAKTKLGLAGMPNNHTKAGVITLKLPSATMPTVIDNVFGMINKVTGLDQIQILNASSAPISFLKNTTAGTVSSGNTGSNEIVDSAGEWQFVNSTDVFSFWDGAAMQSITLTGISIVTTEGGAFLKITY